MSTTYEEKRNAKLQWKMTKVQCSLEMKKIAMTNYNTLQYKITKVQCPLQTKNSKQNRSLPRFKMKLCHHIQSRPEGTIPNQHLPNSLLL